jgi:hypothetical protein
LWGKPKDSSILASLEKKKILASPYPKGEVYVFSPLGLILFSLHP